MAQNRTELVFILDRSGSMNGLEADTIGGYNAMLAQQQAQEGKAWVTTVLFDDTCELLHDRVPLEQVKPITEREYYVRGCTALLDALGSTLQRVIRRQRSLPKEERADKVLFVITTDGMENASREYDYATVKRMVEREKELDGWEFLFLGANIDAVATASCFGIRANRAVNYHADSQGTRVSYQAVSQAACAMRSGAPMSDGWKADIEADFKGRKKSGRVIPTPRPVKPKRERK